MKPSVLTSHGPVAIGDSVYVNRRGYERLAGRFLGLRPKDGRCRVKFDCLSTIVLCDVAGITPCKPVNKGGNL
ncbi:MAG TPA: hypothetical protein VMW54_11800 [Terriglobia bacterium]|nr:hypothetical protein [Terriglobia bacterium]